MDEELDLFCQNADEKLSARDAVALAVQRIPRTEADRELQKKGRVDALRALQANGYSDSEIIDAWITLFDQGSIPDAYMTFGFIEQIGGDIREKTLDRISKIVNNGL